MTDTATVEALHRVSGVAEYLDCDDDSVYKLIRDGKLRAIRVGRLIRVPQSALDDFVAGR